MALLEEEEDVNQLTEYFSYEHFYVIYCKFWELDSDHDLYIDQKDLARHNDNGNKLTDCLKQALIHLFFIFPTSPHFRSTSSRPSFPIVVCYTVCFMPKLWTFQTCLDFG